MTARMNASPLWIPGVKKIAVLRANALGDYIFAQPALYALRAAYPQAEIILLGRAWHVDYICVPGSAASETIKRPGPVDRAVAIPRIRGVSDPDTWSGPEGSEQVIWRAETDSFFARMQSEGFDLALQMHGGGGNSNPFVQRLGARITAGMRATGAPPLDRWIPYIYWQHEVLRLLEVARLVGAPPVMIEPRIEVTEYDLIESCAVVPEDEPQLVVLHPGASDARRRWPAERFAAVGDALVRAGNQVALVGIPSEAGLVQSVINAMQQPAQNLCGALSLHALTGLIARAALVIANDSGPRHLAEAVGTPTVGIYWCGNLINAGSAFRTYHRPHLSWRIQCPVCGQNTLKDPCEHEVSFVDEVQVAEVLRSAQELLELGRDDRDRAV